MIPKGTYSRHAGVVVASVLSNTDEDVCFHILHDETLTDENKRRLEETVSKSLSKSSRAGRGMIDFVDVSDAFSRVNDVDMEKISLRFTRGALFRLMLPDIMSHLDKIIYLDCDMEIKHSLSELFSTDISQNPLAMVKDAASEKHKKRLNIDEYFNAGMLLMNLNYLRETSFSQKIFDWINVHQEVLKLHDQDVLNLYFAGKIKKLDEIWNFQCKELTSVKTLPNACIIHYVARDKRDFVYNSFPLFLKTPFQKAFLTLYAGRLLKSIGQKFFRLRNLNQEKKELSLLGLKFTLNRR